MEASQKSRKQQNKGKGIRFNKIQIKVIRMEEKIEEKNLTPVERQPDEQSLEEDQNKFFHYRDIKSFEHIPLNTIDDGVCDSIGREFSSMGYKFSFVLCPRKKGNAQLRSWDLWGPFFMCLIFGIFINNANEFLLLFLAAFGGAVIVTFNIRALGGQISFLQSVSTLGYCIFPLFIAGVVLKLLEMMGFKHILVKILIMMLGAIWGVIAANMFIVFNINQDRRGVALYPILLFYLFIGFIVLYM